eukprot:2907087-Alexandrium_andersonii.AAC.1
MAANAHNQNERMNGYTPNQWAFGAFGYNNINDGELHQYQKMDLAKIEEIRLMAENTFREVKAKEIISRAMNSRGRPRIEQLRPGDWVEYWRTLHRGRESGRWQGPCR